MVAREPDVVRIGGCERGEFDAVVVVRWLGGGVERVQGQLRAAIMDNKVASALKVDVVVRTADGGLVDEDLIAVCLENGRIRMGPKDRNKAIERTLSRDKS